MIENKIIIVDDDENIRELVSDVLEAEKFKVIKCSNTDEGYKRILKSKPDLAILDVKMPQIGGIELCRLLRENLETKKIPVIMLTVESTETDKIIGLGVGADDYITKPFSNKELVARVRALLRRINRTAENNNIFEIDDLVMNLEARTVSINSKEIKLRPKEFDLLHMFLLKQNVVLTREFILEDVFEYNVAVTTRTIDTHIKNLRKALGDWGERVVTIFGRGFKFVPSIKKKK
ncbi:MAG: response regulator transcription factor [Endomicrobiia bacterium]|nr:response regulator transcription factor [Endomicrobiaceae bacterium]MDD3053039.1 response regulator transcription factor [Endomicrobiaceae bacterium]MDD3922175.1 response regulator transcription factor [Endomicrobiaceae bacterium]MDD5102169.1 response regulator transcription factor [Endomicrobiaceae bacterium]